MIWIKVSLFFLTVTTVKFIFKFINDYGDKRLNFMKEILNFTDYLRIYSCQMKMSLEEICLKYNYRGDELKKVILELQRIIGSTIKNKYELQCCLKEELHTPEEFNKCFSDIIDYYGSAYSDVLDNKLLFTIRELENFISEFEASHREKKNLNNRISLLVGCLTAIILV
jgi:hypothetical protein